MVRPYRLEQARTVPVAPDDAFAGVLPAPLPQVFARRYGPFPPVREVRGQVGAWGDVGQQRTIVTADGGTMLETLSVVDEPHRFGYTLTDVTGPMRLLITTLDGEWTFEPVGSGTRITWRWTVQPASAAAGPAMPVVARLWHPYAARALARVEGLLLET